MVFCATSEFQRVIKRTLSVWSFLSVWVLLAISGGLSTIVAAESGTVAGWGYYDSPQLVLPIGLTNVLAVSVGSAHCLALTDTHTVVAWGNNSFPFLTNMPPSLTNVVSVAAGAAHSLALKGDGKVVTWGSDLYQILEVPADLPGVRAVAVGTYFSVVLLSNGTVRAWGDNSQGQTSIPVGLTNVIAIAAGDYHTLALRVDGTVVAWGHNQTNVPSGMSNVVLISACARSSLAATVEGNVWKWEQGASTVNLQGTWPGLRQMSGYYHNVVLKEDASIEGWGYNSSGELTFPPDLTNVTALSAGFRTTFVVVRGPALRVQPRSMELLAGTNAILTASGEARDPFSQQWLLNGEPLPQATNKTLVFSPVLPAHAGSYSFMVSNVFGTMTSTSAALTVVPMRIFDQTRYQDVATGQDAWFSVHVEEGLAPVTYQWFFNHDHPIPGATNAAFVLKNARYADEGLYSVLVSNQYGTVLCPPARLTVGPLWSIDDASVVKTYGRTNILTFNLHLIEGRPEPLVLSYVSQPDSAAAGLDYLLAPGSVTFPPWVTNLTVDVQILGSTNREPKRFFLTIYTIQPAPPL
jgi:hypothetical protein